VLAFDEVQAVPLLTLAEAGRRLAGDILLPMVEGQPNQHLVELLSPGSSLLSSLSQHSSNIATLNRIRLISAYETKRSRTTKVSSFLTISLLSLELTYL